MGMLCVDGHVDVQLTLCRANFNNNQAKVLNDFEYEFNAAKSLPGTNGWTSARLYTMIQHGTTNTVIEAIQAAINTQTTLLLGMWCSAGQDNFNNEIAALKAAIAQYGTAFTDLVEGISVGSEDLYRVTPTSINQNGGPGAQPQELINYVKQTRDAIRGTPLEGKPIGHVDTWTVYVNATNNDFISTLDFVPLLPDRHEQQRWQWQPALLRRLPPDRQRCSGQARLGH
jgi:glucan endo-1,3-beta-D-glucosidase